MVHSADVIVNTNIDEFDIGINFGTDRLPDEKEITPVGLILKMSLNPYVPKFEGDE